jgi:hypothetical protein
MKNDFIMKFEYILNKFFGTYVKKYFILNSFFVCQLFWYILPYFYQLIDSINKYHK